MTPRDWSLDLILLELMRKAYARGNLTVWYTDQRACRIFHSSKITDYLWVAEGPLGKILRRFEEYVQNDCRHLGDSWCMDKPGRVVQKLSGILPTGFAMDSPHGDYVVFWMRPEVLFATAHGT